MRLNFTDKDMTENRRILDFSGWSLMGKVTFAFGFSIFMILFFISINVVVNSWHLQENTFFYLVQVLMALCVFVTPAVVCAVLFRKQDESSVGYLAMNRASGVLPFVLGVCVIVLALPFINYVSQINEQIIPPSAQSLALERKLMGLLAGATPLQFVLNLVVIAMVPAVCEEIFFRGLLVNRAVKYVNPHVAVWSVAFLFSACHFQNEGLFPRAWLGAVLGYMLLWSRSVWLPALVHFVNNGSIVCYLYAFPEEAGDEIAKGGAAIDTIGADNLPLAVLSLVLAVGVMFVLRRCLLKQEIAMM